MASIFIKISREKVYIREAWMCESVTKIFQ